MHLTPSSSSPCKVLNVPGKKPNLEWSKEEKEKLETFVQKELSLKQISILLGRTPTAVNKALTRFGIRLASSPRPPRKPSSPATKSSVPLEVPKAKPLAVWCHLAEVVKWLEQEQIKIVPVTVSGFKDFPLHVFQEKPSYLITPAQVLILANKRRAQKELPLFHIPSLTGE